MRLPICLLLAALLAACAGPDRRGEAPLAADAVTFLDTTGAPLSPRHLQMASADARYVLVGESHGSSCDHLAQAALIQALAQRRPAVGLEMVTVDRQPVLDRFHAGELGVEELDEALGWSRHWGHFDRYLPVFQVAARADLPLVALNVPAEVVQQVGRLGADGLPPWIPALILPPPEQEAMLRRAWEAHPHGTEPGGWDRFVRIQSLWDTAMALRAREAAGDGRPVIVLAGAGHVIHGWGIAHRLRRLDPGAGILLVMPWRSDDPPDATQADLFFRCPGIPVTEGGASRPAPGGSGSPPAG